jgi:hypothetical protein
MILKSLRVMLDVMHRILTRIIPSLKDFVIMANPDKAFGF